MVSLARVIQPLVLLVILGSIYVVYQDNFLVAKVVHLIAVISWFAGLFYLPRLFVYHAMATESVVRETLKVMEYKLFHYIMQPAAVLTIAGGAWMLHLWEWQMPKWLHWKLVLVLVLLFYHYACWHYVNTFKRDENARSHTYYRVFNEVPTVILIAIVILAVFKPMN